MEELSILDDRYVMLPLDDESESPFKINANTRNISTPKITVLQDDQNAEIIIFEIDRYFDYKDLNETSIWVQWTAPGPNGSVRESASEIELRDLSIPNKMRLGWFVDSDITAYPGTVKYSVRFWCQENINGTDTVVYSFNTVTSSFTVTPSLQRLNVDADVNAPIRDSIFRKAIKNSQIVTEGVVLPLTPSFSTPGKDLEPTASLKDNALTFEAQAVIGDGGYIEYEWYYKPAVDMPDYNMNAQTFYPFSDITEVNDEGEIVVAVEGFGAKLHGDNVAEAKKDKYVKYDYSKGLALGDQYYTKAADDSQGWLPYTSTIAPEDGTELYERYTTYTVPATGTVTGQYQVRATNTIGFNTSKEQSSTICRLLSPDDVIFSTNLPESLIINGSADLNVKLAKQSKEGTEITYTWAKGTDSDVIDEAIDDADNTSGSYTVVSPGYYQVTASALLNRETKTATSQKCMVTFMPAIPETSYGEISTSKFNDKWNGPMYDDETATLDLVVSSVVPPAYVGYDPKLFSESMTYTWIVIIDEDPTTRRVLTAEDVGVLVESGLGTPTLVVKNPEGLHRYTFKCLITNNLNGKTVTQDESNALLFHVM